MSLHLENLPSITSQPILPSEPATMTSPQRPTGNLEVIEWRLRALEEDRRRFADALEVLARLEQHHETTRMAVADAATAARDHEGRLREVETVVPVLRLTSRWIIAGVMTIVGSSLAQVWQALAAASGTH
jgi:hypothetical protein